MCVGEGPVVHVAPVELDWGQTPVLTDLSKSVILSNESLIPAPFSCAMVDIILTSTLKILKICVERRWYLLNTIMQILISSFKDGQDKIVACYRIHHLFSTSSVVGFSTSVLHLFIHSFIALLITCPHSTLLHRFLQLLTADLYSHLMMPICAMIIIWVVVSGLKFVNFISCEQWVLHSLHNLCLLNSSFNVAMLLTLLISMIESPILRKTKVDREITKVHLIIGLQKQEKKNVILDLIWRHVQHEFHLVFTIQYRFKICKKELWDKVMKE